MWVRTFFCILLYSSNVMIFISLFKSTLTILVTSLFFIPSCKYSVKFNSRPGFGCSCLNGWQMILEDSSTAAVFVFCVRGNIIFDYHQNFEIGLVGPLVLIRSIDFGFRPNCFFAVGISSNTDFIYGIYLSYSSSRLKRFLIWLLLLSSLTCWCFTF